MVWGRMTEVFAIDFFFVTGVIKSILDKKKKAAMVYEISKQKAL
jgi:hypothetical protein